MLLLIGVVGIHVPAPPMGTMLYTLFVCVCLYATCSSANCFVLTNSNRENFNIKIPKMTSPKKGGQNYRPTKRVLASVVTELHQVVDETAP